jgi:hypothetical protein
MKHGVFILAFCALHLSIESQTLQFSQVKLVSTVETVPANKVWKIEGFFPTTFSRYSGSSGVTEGHIYNLVVNGNNRPLGVSSFLTGYWGTSYAGNIGNFPLWIPAGTTLAAGSNVGEISVIEFTVVP